MEQNKPQSELVVERAKRYHAIKHAIMSSDLRRTVDQLSMMMDNAFNCTLLLKMPDCNPSKTTVDLEPLDKDALGDESEGWRLLEDTIVGGLVKSDGVLCLVLDLSLRPLLLLCSFATG